MTGIICAMTIEAEGIISDMENKEVTVISGIEYTVGKLYGKDVVVAVCGVGKVFAAACAQTMILKYAPKEIINVGVAGSLVADLKVFDVAVARDLCQHDMDTTSIGDPIGLLSGIKKVKLPACERINKALIECLKSSGLNYKEGTIASGDQFIAEREKKNWIRDTFDAVACEMEGGSVAQICYINGVDFAVLRAISDEEGGDYAVFAKKAAENSAMIIKEYIRNNA